MPGCTPETYLLHPEGDFSGGHLQQGSDELTGDIHLHYLCLPRLAPHDGVAQQPLCHHLRARTSHHPVCASRAYRKHAAFASRLTVDTKDFDNLGQNCAVVSWPSTTSRYYCHELMVTGLPNSPLSLSFCTLFIMHSNVRTATPHHPQKGTRESSAVYNYNNYCPK